MKLTLKQFLKTTRSGSPIKSSMILLSFQNSHSLKRRNICISDVQTAEFQQMKSSDLGMSVAAQFFYKCAALYCHDLIVSKL